MRRAGVLAVAVATLVAAAPANAFPVVSGELEHRWANVFETSAPANTNRTWLGYSTGPTPSNANGTASPILPAVGPRLSVISPRGAGQVASWSHPATVGGSYDPATRTGTLEFAGGIRFEAPPFPVGHGFVITFENPRIELDGTTGRLFASGTNAEGAAYGKSAPVYDLDLSGATVTDGAGSVTITGIVPRIATEGFVYPATYGTGAGPERTPNTFGSFAVTASSSPLGAAPAPSPTPSAEPSASPAPSTTPAVETPPAARASAVRLTRSGLRFTLSRVVRTRVVVERRRGKGGYARVSALRFTPERARVVLPLSPGPGRYRVTVAPEGGPVLRTLRRL